MTPAPSDRDGRRERPARVESGLGVLCAEAQADGVPCSAIGKDCETCERAVASRDDRDVADPHRPT